MEIIWLFVIAIVAMVIVYALANMSKKGASCCCAGTEEKKDTKPAGKA